MAKESTNAGAPVGRSGGSALSGPARASQDLVRRLPPYNEDAEQIVLAALMLYEDQRDDIFATLKADDFYVPRHGIIYQACLDLYQAHAPVEPNSLSEKLQMSKQLEVAGGNEYLFNLSMRETEAVHGARFYAPLVRSKAMQRELIYACAHIMTDAYDLPHTEVGGLLDEAEHRIFQIAESTANTNDLRKVGDLRDAFFDALTANARSKSSLTGVTTGFIDLDRQTGGLQASDLIIVAARPSMGKTAFSLNLALNAAHAGYKIAFFSLEMSASQLEARLISMTSKVSLQRIRQPRFLSDEDWKRLFEGADQLTCDLYIDDTPALRTMDLRAKARRMKSRMGLDLIIVDYLQLMRPSRPQQSRELEISDISRTLKALAKELDIPVIALSQLNRKLEERTDKRPMLSDLRESGAIEQDADVIMFLYRDDVYARKKRGDQEETGGSMTGRLLNSPTEVIVGKQRNGPVGTVHLLYQCEYTSFEDMTTDYVPSPSENGTLT